MLYRGYEIKRINYQGCVCYIVPQLTRQGEQHEVATNLKTAKRWVDLHIWDCYTEAAK